MVVPGRVQDCSFLSAVVDLRLDSGLSVSIDASEVSRSSRRSRRRAISSRARRTGPMRSIDAWTSGNDLGQGLGSDVIRSLVVDHPNLLARANPTRQLVQGDISALLGVVELSAAVAFDESNHCLFLHRRTSPATPNPSARPLHHCIPRCGMHVKTWGSRCIPE